jgi:hypothetical protein
MVAACHLTNLQIRRSISIFTASIENSFALDASRASQRNKYCNTINSNMLPLEEVDQEASMRRVVKN